MAVKELRFPFSAVSSLCTLPQVGVSSAYEKLFWRFLHRENVVVHWVK